MVFPDWEDMAGAKSAKEGQEERRKDGNPRLAPSSSALLTTPLRSAPLSSAFPVRRRGDPHTDTTWPCRCPIRDGSSHTETATRPAGWRTSARPRPVKPSRLRQSAVTILRRSACHDNSVAVVYFCGTGTMRLIPPITPDEFFHHLQRCIPPFGWSPRIGRRLYNHRSLNLTPLS